MTPDSPFFKINVTDLSSKETHTRHMLCTTTNSDAFILSGL